MISVKCAAHFPLSNYVNSIFKSLDALYAEFAKNSGMPETAFYIMMAVHSEASECTQADICEKWAMSRQTVNSALKKLEKGLRYAREHIEPIFQFEKCAWEGLSEKQREQFLSLSKEYYQAFKAAMGQFYQSK